MCICVYVLYVYINACVYKHMYISIQTEKYCAIF